ncbi:MAG: FAD-dependent oxidoreductase [Deltaproteobacteria bacterium]|nr:FAD-dependent oxidoreductase [Deltaproteobacteria bacterium]
MKEMELVIIGGGPGGIAAAIEAVKAGVTVVLLDENLKPGGQIYRQFENGFVVNNPKPLGPAYEKGQALLQKFESIRNRMTYVNNALVWGLFPERELTYQRNGISTSIRCQKLIIAPGAYDRPVPFPGWTLPGVFTAGGAQRFVKTQGVLPGENILLAGTGPLQLALASQIITAGGNIRMILEAGNVSNWPEFIKGIWGQWELLSEGWQYMRNIVKARVPILRRHIILEVRGKDHVEEALIAQVDGNWRPLKKTRRTVPVDTVCLGYGLVPSTEITRLANCQHQYESRLGGWIPVRHANMETSVPGIFAVGDGSGVSGSQIALEEGRVAGISIAESLGRLSLDEARQQKQPAMSKLEKLNRFRRVLDRLSLPGPGLYELAHDDTIVCRCEEITLGEIRKAVAGGARDINEVKRITRLGMGRCQGRMCGPAIVEIMQREHISETPTLRYLNPRPPFKPIGLGVVMQHESLKELSQKEEPYRCE